MSEAEVRVDSLRTGGGRAAVAALLVVLVAYLALAVGSARQKSVTVDELGHLPSGLYLLATGDLRYASLNPPLANALSALPVLGLDLAAPIEPPDPSDDVFSFWSNGYHFQERHRSDYLRIFAAARLAPILVVAGLGLLLYAWGRRLAPESPGLAGVLAAGFVLLSPNVLAHARLVGTDTATAFFVTLAHAALAATLARPGLGTSLAGGLALGLALLTKLYALLLFPVFLVVALAWPAGTGGAASPLRRRLACLAAAFTVSVAVLDTGYLWQEVGASLSDLTLASERLRALQGSVLGALPLPVPGAFVRAFDGQLVELDSSLRTFLFGETFEGGRWYLPAALLAVKTPLALFAAFGLAVASTGMHPRLPRHVLVLLLAYPVLLFLVLSASPGRQLGARALLSAVPLVWLWAAASIARTRRPAIRVAAALALVATAVTSFACYPHYLSYFNPFAGGSEQGYRHAATANVDIGQDLVALADFLEAEGAATVQLLYFGSVDPALYGIDYTVPEGGLEPGLLAVSVSLYRIAYPTYDHGTLRVVGPVEVLGLGEPVARLGGSIHVYRVPEGS